MQQLNVMNRSSQNDKQVGVQQPKVIQMLRGRQVSWANASLRYPEELPELSAPGRGVVREDPLSAGFSVHATLSPRGAPDSPRSPPSDNSGDFVSASSNGSSAVGVPAASGGSADQNGSSDAGVLSGLCYWAA